jgi:cytochrome b subunit of formate dehydrogenase
MVVTGEDEDEPAGREASPSRVPEPSTARDARWFHRWRAMVDGAPEASRRNRLVLLLGPPRSSKSSLVLAGLLALTLIAAGLAFWHTGPR